MLYEIRGGGRGGTKNTLLLQASGLPAGKRPELFITAVCVASARSKVAALTHHPQILRPGFSVLGFIFGGGNVASNGPNLLATYLHKSQLGLSLCIIHQTPILMARVPPPPSPHSTLLIRPFIKMSCSVLIVMDWTVHIARGTFCLFNPVELFCPPQAPM